MKNPIYYIFVYLSLFSCSKERNHPIDFYYWRSNFQVNESEKKVVQDLKVENIYIRFFDVDKTDIQPKPIGTIKNFNASVLNVNYIPTVFITNRTFQSLSSEEVKKLAANVNKLINEIAFASELKSFSEIQIDCDWTKSTKANYFLFLEELKKISDKKLSATLRLHQVKYKDKEGVPPLNKMVLMCYATENPTEVEEKNSILDVEIAKNYLQNLEQYPFQLDVALPIYSWAIVTNHLGKVKLINSFSKDDLKDKPVIDKGNGIYEVTEDFFLEKFYLSKGFKIKVETISEDVLKETTSFLDSKLKNDYRIIYYHLDEKFTQNYNLKNL